MYLNKLLLLLVCGMCTFSLTAIQKGNKESNKLKNAKYELAAGDTFYIDFPQLDSTWRQQPARAGVYLPKNYKPRKKYPLLVWFGGGAGTDNPKKLIGITEGEDFICVALPYHDDGNNKKGGWQTSWGYFKTMLDKVEEVVPNIDQKRRVAGGFSSGGAAIMFQIGNSNREFQEYFYAFIPGGAGWPMGELESIKGRPMLAVMGDKDKRLPNFRKLEDAAIKVGVDFTFLLIENQKHGFPPTAYPSVRAWLNENIIQGKIK